jgi:hypothetical protein
MGEITPLVPKLSLGTRKKVQTIAGHNKMTHILDEQTEDLIRQDFKRLTP